MKPSIAFALTCLAAITSGCSSLEPKYGCPAPDGISCMSISEVSERDEQGWPMRRKDSDDKEAGREAPEPRLAATGAFPGPRPSSAGDPIFREPRRLRVWVVDWEDRHRVYHPNHYLYLTVDDGEWLLPLIREKLAEERLYD